MYLVSLNNIPLYTTLCSSRDRNTLSVCIKLYNLPTGNRLNELEIFGLKSKNSTPFIIIKGVPHNVQFIPVRMFQMSCD